MADFSQYLNIRSAYAPSFAPDGAALAFISNITGVPQVWRVPSEGGWPDQLTFFGERVSSVAYAPVGDTLLFGMDVGGSERTQLFLLADGGARLVALTEQFPQAIHYLDGASGGWSPDGRRIAFASNRRSAADFDIYVQEVGPSAQGQPELIYEARGTNRALAWGPDGSWLVVQAYHAPANQDLYRLDLGSGALTLLTPHQGDARFAKAQLAPDGRALYCVTDAGSDLLYPARLDLETLELRRIEAVDAWDVDELALSPDGRTLAIAFNADGRSSWRLIDLAGGRELPAPQLPGGMLFSAARWSPDSAALAFDFTGPRNNCDLWLHTPASGNAARQVTRSSRAGLPRESFVEPELVRYASFDGRMIPAWLYRPQGAAPAGLPVIVDVHGGPESQRRVEFNAVYQYFLSCGYALLAPNVRGSTGYGKAYEKLDNVERRLDSVADLAYAARWLQTSGLADPARIAVMGGSYGGYMVLAALTEYPELWAAGVDIVGIANWITFLENTGPWRRHLREAEYGSLEHDRELLTQLSPLHKVDRIRAPLLVIHGANDPRVPVGEAEQIVESLRRRSNPVEYLRFEDEGHGIVKLANRLVCYPAIARFLDQYLRANHFGTEAQSA
jgi:dipeptidyl aminopeptidase/acylaminoacyl peptidase